MGKAEKLVVTLIGGAPWGFRLSGGGGLPLVINKLRKKSQAHKAGLQEGDAVISVNGTPVHDKTQDAALELVEKARYQLNLEIYRGDIDEISQKKVKKTIQVPHEVVVTAQTAEDKSFESGAPSFAVTASVDEVTSDVFNTQSNTTIDEGGFKLIASVDDVSHATFSTDQSIQDDGFTLTTSVDGVTSSAADVQQSSPVFLIADDDFITSSVTNEQQSSPVFLISDSDVVTSATSHGLQTSPVLLMTDFDEKKLSHHEQQTSPVMTSTSHGLQTSPVLLMTQVDEKKSSRHEQQTSPVFLVADNGMSTSIHSAEVEAISSSIGSPVQMATPFTDSTVIAEDPTRLSPNPPRRRSRSSKKNSNSPQELQTIENLSNSLAQNGFKRVSPAQSNGPKSPILLSPQPKPQSVSPKTVFSPKPTTFSPKPVQSQQPQQFSPKPAFSPQPPIKSPIQATSPIFQPTSFSPKPAAPPAVSPKPMFAPTPLHQRAINGGNLATSAVSSSTFDDGRTRREVTHQVKRSDDGHGGSTTTTVRRETTTTNVTNKTAQPFSSSAQNNSSSNIISNKSSAFNVVQTNGFAPYKNSSTPSLNTSRATLQVTTTNNNYQSNISSSRSTGDLSPSRAPMFKPMKFVPGGSKKDIPGLDIPGGPIVDAEGNVTFGKENMAPRFEVKNILPDQSRSKARDVWRPNMWLPNQKPASDVASMAELETPTLRDDFSPYNTFPLPKVKHGQSLVKEQLKKLEGQSRSNYNFADYYDENYDETRRHHRPDKLHVFAPPVEIHADGVYDSPTSPYITFSADGEPVYMYDYEGGPQSPGATKRKNLYGDSAFYDTPSHNYPTIKEQIQLCKRIAQSLTSAANKRARGAKMFMRRKRKSGKWVHEGHSEWSSSAGDVANIRDLDSELSPDDGGNKPLLYFKIPNLKHRVAANKAKQTKMALTQAQFERLRLESKKCEHKTVPPDTCFGIVADLKAHKGKGGRMFERRRERSDRYVIDESNSRSGAPGYRRLEQVLTQPVKQNKTPWEAAAEHGNVDAAFSHLTEWERNQQMNSMLQKASSPRKIPLASGIQTAPMPAMHNSSLKGDGPALLRGKDFNRTARGWCGGGEYPVADNLHHVSPTRTVGPSINADYNNKIKAWQTPGLSPYAPDAPAPELSEPSKRQDEWQPSRVEYRPNPTPFTPAQPRPLSWMSGSYHSGVQEESDYRYAPLDYRYAPESYPTVAYMQPIIPGTDC